MDKSFDQLCELIMKQHRTPISGVFPILEPVSETELNLLDMIVMLKEELDLVQLRHNALLSALGIEEEDK